MFALSSRVRQASGNVFVLQAISRERALLVIQESSREFPYPINHFPCTKEA